MNQVCSQTCKSSDRIMEEAMVERMGVITSRNQETGQGHVSARMVGRSSLISFYPKQSLRSMDASLQSLQSLLQSGGV